MKIGNVTLKKPTVLAPMAGVTDKAFRKIVKEKECGLVYTEMVSAKALIYKNQKTFELIDLSDEEPPISIQLFGSEPFVIAEAAKIVEEKGANIIDINMGCPVPKVVKNGEGSALMLNPKLASEIVRQAVKAVKIPITVKIRKGWDEDNVNAVEFAKRMEDSGAFAVAVHGRTKKQLYTGNADWTIIEEVKNKINIPVLGNGDIFSAEDAVAMLSKTNCDFIMIGRGCMGNPWIFQNINRLLSGKSEKIPRLEEKIYTAIVHLDLCVKYKGEKIAIREMRKHIAWYFKGLPHAAKMRNAVNRIDSLTELKELLLSYIEA